MWFQNLLNTSQQASFNAYVMACNSKGLDLFSQLRKDLKKGRSSLISPSQYSDVLDARLNIGAKIFDGPVFELGDGISVIEDGRSIPGTVRKISGDYVTVTFDRIHRSKTSVLFEVATDPDDYHIFTRRADGSFQLIGTKGRVSLVLGRAVQSIRSPSRGNVK